MAAVIRGGVNWGSIIVSSLCYIFSPHQGSFHTAAFDIVLDPRYSQHQAAKPKPLHKPVGTGASTVYAGGGKSMRMDNTRVAVPSYSEMYDINANLKNSMTIDHEWRGYRYPNSIFDIGVTNTTLHGVPFRIVPSFFGACSYFQGAINVDNEVFDDYIQHGLSGNYGFLIMHEFGHYLQLRMGGRLEYGYIWRSSLFSYLTIRHNTNDDEKFSPYQLSWTEVDASTRAYFFFHYPKGFSDSHPINKNYLSNKDKYLLFYHLFK